MEIKELLEKYPFLEYRDFQGKLTYENEEERLKYNWWNFWNDSGWEKIWKKYLSVIFQEYDKWNDEEKKNFYILDSKEKYGSLRVDVSYTNDVILEAENILNMISEWTCITCGKMPRNSRNERIIWRTNGWICPYCKDCIKKIYINRVNCNTTKEINRKLLELKDIHNHRFAIKSFSKDSAKIYVYKDLGDWLELNKVEEINDKCNNN